MISYGGQRVAAFDVAVGMGSLERRNPLPVGRYWVDVFDKDLQAWIAWRSRNANDVKIEVTQHFDSDPPRDFFIFNVTQPVNWEGPGFPTIAPPTVQSSEDTAQRPPPAEDPLDRLHDWINEPSTKVVGGIVIAVIAGVAIMYMISQASSPHARSATT